VVDEKFEPVRFEAVVPRLSDRLYLRVHTERVRTPWTFGISIFKDYQIDTHDKLTECFEFDWTCMKFPKMSEEDMGEVKEEMRAAYFTM
jgi:hypothetical protein